MQFNIYLKKRKLQLMQGGEVTATGTDVLQTRLRVFEWSWCGNITSYGIDYEFEDYGHSDDLVTNMNKVRR